MRPEQAMAARLQSPGVAALAGERMYFGRAPQGAVAPFVVWTRISGQRSYTLAGRCTAERGRFQVDCYAATAGAAAALAEAVCAAVEAGPPGGMWAEVDAVRDLYDSDVPALFRRSVDFMTLA